MTTTKEERRDMDKDDRDALKKEMNRGKQQQGQNFKAFSVAHPYKMQRSMQRRRNREHRRIKAPVVRRVDQEEPPPLTIVVQGPAGSGKSTLIRSLVKLWTRQSLGEIADGPITVVTGKKSRLTLVECANDLNSMADLAKVADVVLLMIDSRSGFEMETFEFLNMLQVHGFPRVMGVLTHLDYYKDDKAARKMKRRLKKRFWTEIYQGAKLFYLTGVRYGKYQKAEMQNLARFLSHIKFKPLTWRSQHPFILVDRFEDVTDPSKVEQEPESDRKVVMFGYVRGTSLKPSTKMHVPGLGDFSMDSLKVMDDPCPLPERENVLQKSKKSKLKAKETLIYAPMAQVGNILFDQDATYVRLPQRVKFSRTNTSGESASDVDGSEDPGTNGHSQQEAGFDEDKVKYAGGDALMKGLQSLDVGLSERLDESSIQLFSNSKPVRASEVKDFDAFSRQKSNLSSQAVSEKRGNKLEPRKQPSYVRETEDEDAYTDKDSNGPIPDSDPDDDSDEDSDSGIDEDENEHEHEHDEDSSSDNDFSDFDENGGTQARAGSTRWKERLAEKALDGFMERKNRQKSMMEIVYGGDHDANSYNANDSSKNRNRNSDSDSDDGEELNDKPLTMNEDDDEEDDDNFFELKSKSKPGPNTSSLNENGYDFAHGSFTSSRTGTDSVLANDPGYVENDIARYEVDPEKLRDWDEKSALKSLKSRFVTASSRSDENKGLESGTETGGGVGRNSYDSDDDEEEIYGDFEDLEESEQVESKVKAGGAKHDHDDSSDDNSSSDDSDDSDDDDDDDDTDDDDDYDDGEEEEGRKEEQSDDSKSLATTWEEERRKNAEAKAAARYRFEEAYAVEKLGADGVAEAGGVVDGGGDGEGNTRNGAGSIGGGGAGGGAGAANTDQEHENVKSRYRTNAANLEDLTTEVEKQTALNKAEFADMDPETRIRHEGVKPGRYVRVELSGVPCEFVKHFQPRSPLIMGGLQAHEGTLSLVRVRLKKHRWFPKVLKTNDPLVFSVGWRRFQAVPVYSTEDTGKGIERQRMIKYTHEHLHCIASFWAPAIPPNTGILGFQDMRSGQRNFRISATGVVLELDQSSQIVKKLKLTGTPFKIFKNTAFVQGMFNTDVEVARYEGASIRTVSGVRGMVKKSLKGGKGNFRATFEDKILMSDIIICRAWVPVEPKRFYNPVTSLLTPAQEEWQGMKTLAQLRHERGLSIPSNADSVYRPIERQERRFNPLHVSEKLQAQLPYKSKPKQTVAKGKKKVPQALKGVSAGLGSMGRAAVMSPNEKKVHQLLQHLSTVRVEKKRKRQEANQARNVRRTKEQQREAEKFAPIHKEEKKKAMRQKGLKEKDVARKKGLD